MNALALPQIQTCLQLDEDTTAEDWEAIGLALQAQGDSLKWQIGDWMAYGVDILHKSYAEAAHLTGYSTATLVCCAWLSRCLPPDRRNPALSWKHHEALGKLSPEGQAHFLCLAEREAWSTRDLIEAVRTWKTANALQLALEPIALPAEASASDPATSAAPASPAPTPRLAMPSWVEIEVSPSAFSALCALRDHHNAEHPERPLSLREFASRVFLSLSKRLKETAQESA